ncbi:hypothetical protein ACSBR1_027503 [Camellia fascicularis]
MTSTSSEGIDIVFSDNRLEEEYFVDSELGGDLNNANLSENQKHQPIKSSLCNNPLEPCEGMIFDELEDAMTCYNAYARRKGFDIRKNHTRLSSKDKSLIGVEFACTREGYRRPSYQKKNKNVTTRPMTMIGCKAMMRLRKDEGKWVVSKFVTEHNHDLCSPKSTLLLRGHRKMTLAQKNLIDMLNEAGVPSRKIASVLSQESSGDCNGGCVIMDIQNYLGSKRRKLLKDGDAQRMYNYFIKSQSENLDFIYAVEVDENHCMGNCFWADARSRLAYQHFGDVVTFDATYLTNRYGMPFVPFTGVNHHYQSIMFGCALLVNETTESYIWLLKTWLETMGGHNPAVIITDDDKAMAKAISYVLPNSIHRLCMWHILQKVPEHLAHVYNKYSSFQGEFHHCIHDTVTIEEFENEWDELVCKYELRENEWLKDLYMRREKWVPTYLRTAFCAGMSTTQRSESMNKFFKDFVHSSTLVSDFVHQYEKALDRRHKKEKEKDVKTRTTKAILKTCYKMEAEAGEVYTRKIFLLFQEELFSSQKHKASKYLEEGTKKTYKVMANGKEKKIYEVEFDGVEKKATCSCHMFEFVGILCRHILTVFVKKSLVDYLPKQYVLRRWTINVKDHAAHENLKDAVQEGKQISYTMMRNSLIIEFLKVVEEGQKSQKKHDYLALALQKTHCELLAMDDDSNEIGNDDNSGNEILLEGGKQVLSNLEFTLQDPLTVASKGRPKSLRQKHPKENNVGKKRKCSICKQTGHIRTSCHQQNQPRDNANVSLSPTSQIFHQDVMMEAGKNIYK